MGWQASDVFTIKRDIALRGLHPARNHVVKRRLASAVGADDSHGLLRHDVQIDAQDRSISTKTFGKVRYGENWISHFFISIHQSRTVPNKPLRKKITIRARIIPRTSIQDSVKPVSYTHLRAHETDSYL